MPYIDENVSMMKTRCGRARVPDEFFWANQNFLDNFSVPIMPFIDKLKPVRFQVTGYGFGGSIAHLVSLHIKTLMFAHLEMPKEHIQLQLVTFGGSCTYNANDCKRIESIIGQENTINIYSEDDQRVQISQSLGLCNPGYQLILEKSSGGRNNIGQLLSTGKIEDFTFLIMLVTQQIVPIRNGPVFCTPMHIQPILYTRHFAPD